MKYDYIVFSASLPGVVYAVMMANKGHKVLLINHYGFMGGSLTEELNLYQKKTPPTGKHTQNLINAIKQTQNGILYTNKDCYIFHPEAVKYATWKLTANAENLQILLHATIDYVNANRMFVSTKGGIKKYEAENIIDASDDLLLLRTHTPAAFKAQKAYLHLLTKPINCPPENICKHKLHLYQKLTDNSYFLSYEIDKQHIESDVNDLLLEIEQNLIAKYSARLKYMPLNMEVRYSAQHCAALTHISDLTGNNYSRNNLIDVCNCIESLENTEK